ncbi:MAG: nucleotidyltransferase family protein [Ruminococcus sp.]|nr:nucleotidyltransferase family protein [Ruminococcus sp.]
METFNNEYLYLIHLLKCVLDGTQPQEKPEEQSFEKILKIAIAHDVANIAYYAIEKLKNKPSYELNKKWSEIRDKDIIRDLTQEFEYNTITSLLEKEHIRFLALKGIHLKDLYPQRDIRTMSDLDLLIDPENMSKVKDIMTTLNYEQSPQEKTGNHFAFLKKPWMCVEMHYQLFSRNDKAYYNLMPNPWDYAAPVSPCEWNFDDNWFFLYLFAHLEKHYSKRGTGIRSIMDIYIYLKHKEKDLDWDYIYSQLDKVGKMHICQDLIHLSKIWFGNAKSCPKYDKMSVYIFSSGVYGTKKHLLVNSYNSMNASRYYLSRMFPPLIMMKKRYPILRKMPILLPLFWIIRLISLSILRPKDIKQEIKYINSNKDNDK